MSILEKRSYFCISDDGHSETGFVVLAYSREQIESIFYSPNTKWVTVFESGFEEHEVYKTRVKPYLDKLTFDVDSPTGPLEYYMRKNGIASLE